MADRCRSCEAEIVWVQTTQGRRMPVDKEPSDEGNVWIPGDLTGQVRATVLSKEDATDWRATGIVLYRSHFASCPQAPQWRR